MTATNRPVVRFATIWALQLLGALLLLALSYWWLTWPDEKIWQVAASFAVGVVVVIAWLWMEWIVFAKAYRENQDGYVRPWKILAFAICVAVLTVVEIVVWAFNSSVEQLSVRLAQVAHLPARATVTTLDWISWAAFWIIVPAVLLPIVFLAARDGFAGLRCSSIRVGLAILRKPLYWVGIAAVLVAGIYCPLKLIEWVPERSSVSGEVWSAGLRLTAAYLLATFAIVFLPWLMARLSPDEQQPLVDEQERTPLVSA